MRLYNKKIIVVINVSKCPKAFVSRAVWNLVIMTANRSEFFILTNLVLFGVLATIRVFNCTFCYINIQVFFVDMKAIWSCGRTVHFIDMRSFANCSY